MKKYKLVKSPIKYYRIEALKDFSDVKAGDLGGFVQSEYNLSHLGDCWIYDDATVVGNARVYDDARIYNNARVDDEAQVYGSAELYDCVNVFNKVHISSHAHVFGYVNIYDEVCISGDARVFGSINLMNRLLISTGKVNYNMRSIQGSRHSLNFDGDKKHLFIGCERHTIKDWKKLYKSLGEKYNYKDEEIEEYGIYIKSAEKLLLSNLLTRNYFLGRINVC